MKPIHHLALLALPLMTLSAVPLHAALAEGQGELIAGWDFSQITSPSSMVVDPDGTPVTSLWANYSGLATGTSNNSEYNTDGFIGPDDHAYGTCYFGGGHGSDDLTGLKMVAGTSLTSNPDVCISSLVSSSLTSMSTMFVGYLGSAGQGSYNPRAVRFVKSSTLDASGKSMVFEANIGASDLTASGWTVEYAAQAKAETNLIWSYSTNGTDYTVFSTELIGTADAEYLVDLTTPGARADLDGASEVFIRVTAGEITLSGSSGYVYLDNVAIRATLGSGSAPNPFDGTAIEGYPDYFTSSWFSPYYHEAGTNFYYAFQYDIGWIWTNSEVSSEIYYWDYLLGRWCFTSSVDYPWYGSWDETGAWAGWTDLSAVK